MGRGRGRQEEAVGEKHLLVAAIPECECLFLALPLLVLLPLPPDLFCFSSRSS